MAKPMISGSQKKIVKNFYDDGSLRFLAEIVDGRIVALREFEKYGSEINRENMSLDGWMYDEKINEVYNANPSLQRHQAIPESVAWEDSILAGGGGGGVGENVSVGGGGRTVMGIDPASSYSSNNASYNVIGASFTNSDVVINGHSFSGMVAQIAEIENKLNPPKESLTFERYRDGFTIGINRNKPIGKKPAGWELLFRFNFSLKNGWRNVIWIRGIWENNAGLGMPTSELQSNHKPS